MKFLLSLTLLCTVVQAQNIVIPVENHGFQKSQSITALLQVTPCTPEEALSSVLSREQAEDSEEKRDLVQSQPSETQSHGTFTPPAQEHRDTCCKITTTKESLRLVQEAIYQAPSVCGRSRPQEQKAPWSHSHELQYGAGIPVRLSSIVYTCCEVPEKVEALAHAIAKAEGFYLVGSLSNRYHNPGDLKGKSWTGYVGKGGHAIFATDAEGQAALRHQLEKVIDGSSRYYTLNTTFTQMSHRYATNWKPWVKVVSTTLQVTPDTKLVWLCK